MPTSHSQHPPSSPGGKRRRDSTDKDLITDSTLSPLPPWKKTTKPYKSAAEAITAFWDNLSEITLCQSALLELNRRAPRHSRSAIEGQLGQRSEEITGPSTELQRACRRGGLDLQYLRGLRYNSSRKAAIMNDSEIDYPIGTTHTMLGQHLDDNGIHSVGRNPIPINWGEIKNMMEQPTPLPASYQAQYEAFLNVISEVSWGADVVRRIYPLLAGDNDIYSAKGCRFSNLEKLTDGSITMVSPDRYDGANPNDVDPEILAELSTFVKPIAKKDTPVYPNFFVELKDPKYELSKAEQRARYSGAIGSRAIHRLRSFAVAEPGIVFDGNAYTITAIYHQESLRLYAHHPVKPSAPGGVIKYRMTLIDHIAMNGDLNSFRRGVTALRNSREWARNKRDELITAAAARKRYRDMTPVPDPPPPRLPVPGWSARPSCSPS